MPSPEVLERINRALAVRPSALVEQHRESIRAPGAEHHAVASRIFGSVARGGDEPGSDVDLLVDFTDGASLLDEIGLCLALADLLVVRGRPGRRGQSQGRDARACPSRSGAGVAEALASCPSLS